MTVEIGVEVALLVAQQEGAAQQVGREIGGDLGREAVGVGRGTGVAQRDRVVALQRARHDLDGAEHVLDDRVEGCVGGEVGAAQLGPSGRLGNGDPRDPLAGELVLRGAPHQASGGPLEVARISVARQLGDHGPRLGEDVGAGTRDLSASARGVEPVAQLVDGSHGRSFRTGRWAGGRSLSAAGGR